MGMEPYIAVVGGVNIDICGKSAGPLIARDSNPGTVRLSLGGVGRNIAHNLRLLGCPVRMLTALGEDLYADRVEKDCARLGIDLGPAIRVPGGASSVYLAIEGPEGDMELAICDDALARHITPDYLAGQAEVLNGAAAVAVDTNLSAEALAWLGERCTAPIFADPVSVTKAEKLRPILGKLFLLKPNRIELQHLSGMPCETEEEIRAAADSLLAKGLHAIAVSLGSRGCYYADADGKSFFRRLKPVTDMANATGAGDAFMAGLACAYVRGLQPEDMVDYAMACGLIAVQSEDTINPDISDALVQRTIEAYRE